jgi:hypothetical protein
MAARGGAYLEWVLAIPKAWWENRSGAVVLENILDRGGSREGLPEDQQAILRAAEAKDATQAQADPKRILARLEREYLQQEVAELTRQINQTEDEQAGEQMQRRLMELRARAARLTRGGK